MVYEDGQNRTELTYKELNEKANQLAHLLRKQYDIKPNAFIGFCVDRSVDIAIAMLAILKAGGAYVALDPESNAERIKVILEDAEIGVVITQEHLVNKLDYLSAGNRDVVALDEEYEVLKEYPTENNKVINQPPDLAYLIYTSGTTGKPKGVMVEHGGLVNMLEAHREDFKLGLGCRNLFFSNIGFDGANFEILLPLISGASVNILPEAFRIDAEGLCRYINMHQITIAFLPPTILAVIPKNEKLPSLTIIIVAGEKCSEELMKHWSKGRRFQNSFGLSETTVVCTNSDYKEGDLPTQIGGPIANMKIYLLDEHLQPVPEGEPGELCVGGPCVARGYWKLDKKTAERFVEIEINGESVRIYRTGDWAKYSENGKLIFIGRADRQVKIHGKRVELGEVEAVVNTHSGVKQCAVKLFEPRPGQQILVAYVVSDLKDEAISDVLKTYLGESTLQDYMVPQLFVKLDRMPTTQNGKVDYKQLPDPDLSTLASSTHYVAPETELQKQLIDIWLKILPVVQIGIDDNLFSLGNNSLLAMKTAQIINKQFSVKLATTDLFKHYTIRILAKHIEITPKQDVSIHIPSTKIKSGIPLSSSQELIWLAEAVNPELPVYNEPSAIIMRGQIEPKALERAINEVINRHDILRMRISVVDGAPQQSFNAFENLRALGDFAWNGNYCIMQST